MEQNPDLQKKKLELEIKELEKKWWKNPSYISAWTSGTIAILSFCALLLSGFFDRQKQELEQEVNNLEKLRD